MGRILGLDVSTKTIGISIFEDDGTLLKLTHITPKIKPKPKKTMEEHFRKIDAFEEWITEYIQYDIEEVIIEEPLLGSNNIRTCATLLRFNGMISKVVEEVLGVVPDFISSYEARAKAFPDLMQKRTHKKDGTALTEKEIEKRKPVLFGGHPYTIDKKQIIWDKVADLEPQIMWERDKNQKLKKECFDMSDAYAVGIAWINMKNLPVEEKV